VSFHGEGGSVVLASRSYTVYDNDRSPKVVKEVTSDTSKEHDQQNVYGPGLLYDIGHVENFLQAVRENGTPNSEIVGGHKSVLLCQLGNIAYRTQSGLHIDPVNGHLMDKPHLNRPEAHQLWSREYEPDWKPVV
jgi:hypothetical protein